MAAGVKTRSRPRKPEGAGARKVPDGVFYLYAISREQKGRLPHIDAEGIDGLAPVEAMPCEGHICWVSRVPGEEYGAGLPQRMEDLEWLASAGLRHQRAVAGISSKVAALPARFGTVFLSPESMAQHVKERKAALRDAFRRVADADEFGIKIFALSKARKASVAAANGADYLRQKAELLHPGRSKKLDEDVRRFIANLDKLAVASCPGGKASAGQPGLVWHGSFLVRTRDRRKFENVLKKYAAEWREARRIDWSGPWPPYSFVGEHGR